MSAWTETAELHDPQFVLGIDTCGPSGSVALARLSGDAVEILGQAELAGRTYSARLIAALSELLSGEGIGLAEISAIVAVHGPGSFTGVRVGLSAVKGLAEGRSLGVVPVSRLAVLAFAAGTGWAALDAHRQEIFLRRTPPGQDPSELLAGREDLVKMAPPARIAYCDEPVEDLLRSAWPDAEQVRAPAPAAVHAISLCARRVTTREFTDPIVLDGHYLRRSDAEIFAPSGGPARSE
ncbi:MAG: tRNA (adenosine(37)-N6)-threonylcarbamoyltransferase complex dimerization subunit type 1 TsaB [Acidobacteriota bacterium]